MTLRLTGFFWRHLAPVHVVLIILSAYSAGQQVGNNAVIKDTSGDTAASPSFLDATQFSGADACVKISTTFGNLPSTGGTVDARGVLPTSGSFLQCSINPIPSGAHGTLLLAAATYLAQTPWIIQNSNCSHSWCRNR